LSFSATISVRDLPALETTSRNRPAWGCISLGRLIFGSVYRAKACEHLPSDTLLDGEIIALDQNGRISFNMLQHHRSQAQAILFYAFDVGPEVIFPQRSADEDSCLRSMASLQHATSSSQKRLPVDLPLALN